MTGGAAHLQLSSHGLTTTGETRCSSTGAHLGTWETPPFRYTSVAERPPLVPLVACSWLHHIRRTGATVPDPESRA
jgi:hypothetical protein